MNRVAIGLLMILGVASAQAPFTIVRPQEGAIVREVVQVRFPIASVSPGNFIGVAIDGKFKEAVSTGSLGRDQSRGHYIYYWDTKKLNVPDGEHTIELTLYASEGAQRILGRSSVRVVVENTIQPPAGGILLQYRWNPRGRAVRYNLVYTVKESTELKDTGLTPQENLLNEARVKGDLNILDQRGNLSLISWIIVPPAILGSSGQYQVLAGENFAPVYQEVDRFGRLQYQATSPGYTSQLFYVWTGDLAIFPPRALKPGDRWLGTITLGNPIRTGGASEQVQAQVPASARLERFEWERGYKCAKVVYEFSGEVPGQIDFGGIQLSKPKIKFRREVYFAYDIGQIVRQNTSIEIEVTERQSLGGGFGGTFGGPPTGGRGGMFGGGGMEDEGGLRGPRGGGPRGGSMGGVPGLGMGGQPGGQFGGAQTGQPTQTTVNRLRVDIDMVLERIL